MKIVFGASFDQGYLPKVKKAEGGVYYLGPITLLQRLERILGLSKPALREKDHLRPEQYRRILGSYLEESPSAFFASSYTIDPIGTAHRLLEMRDELLLGGFEFKASPNLPQRIQDLCHLEDLFITQSGPTRAKGVACRWKDVIRALPLRPFPIKEICLVEPQILLPGYLREFLGECLSLGVRISEHKTEKESSITDLTKLTKHLKAPNYKPDQKFSGDGSLLMLRFKGDAEANLFFVKLLSQNPSFRPDFILPADVGALDYCFLQEGLPVFGLTQRSKARPSAQILKLVPSFLWQPVDPAKVMEFVTLQFNPLEPELCALIAQHLSQRPGLFSDSWNRMINQYIYGLKKKGLAKNALQEIQRNYALWFERRRPFTPDPIDKKEVISTFRHIMLWAGKLAEEQGQKTTAIEQIHAFAEQITDLLEALPEEDAKLSPLRLEQIVRSVVDTTPLQALQADQSSMDYCQHPGSVFAPVDDLVWWDFSDSEEDIFFHKWYPDELSFFQQAGIQVPTRNSIQKLEKHQWLAPFQKTRNRLVLVYIESVAGKSKATHPISDYIQTGFSNPEKIILDAPDSNAIAQFFKLPEREEIPPSRPPEPTPLLKVNIQGGLEPDASSPTQMDRILYYPYDWVLKHKMQLRKSPILSIIDENRLKGNVAHRILEKTLKSVNPHTEKEVMHARVQEVAQVLLEKEGAPLLLYGKEPELASFLEVMKAAAWQLTRHIFENHWVIKNTEMALEGQILNLPIKGIADLVLMREDELAVIDLKWRGKSHWRNLITNQEDIQLLLYAHMLRGAETSWPSTAYFIIQDSQMYTRTQSAFKNAQALVPNANEQVVYDEMMDKLRRTLSWRLEQLRQGTIELRTAETAADLDEYYGNQLLNFLEMKSENASFDDFGFLIKPLS